MQIRDDEIGQFLGGILTVLVRNRAHEVAGDMPDEQWDTRRGELLADAHEDVVRVFPEPLRTRLRDDRDRFVADMLGLD